MKQHDEILIEKLICSAQVGLLPEELERPQDIVVTIRLGLSLKSAGASDFLDDSIDYADVVSAVRERLMAKRYLLLEKCAEELCTYLFLRFSRCETISIQLVKPSIIPRCDGVGIALFRERP